MPEPKLVANDPLQGTGWCVTIQPETTVVELATLMTFLALNGRRVAAHHTGAGAFVLLPLDPGTAPPSGAMLAAALNQRTKPCTLIARPNPLSLPDRL